MEHARTSSACHMYNPLCHAKRFHVIKCLLFSYTLIRFRLFNRLLRCSLALTLFLFNSRVFHWECMKCKERYFSRASPVVWTVDHVKLTHSSSADQSNRACQSGIPRFRSCRVGYHFPAAFRLKQVAKVLFVCSSFWFLSSSVQRESYLFVLHFKRGASVLFVLDLTSV